MAAAPIEATAATEDDHAESSGAKRKARGQNKNRKALRVDSKEKVCQSVLTGKPCKFGDSCRFSHNKEDFLQQRPPDLEGSCPTLAVHGYCKYGLACRFSGSHGAQADKTPVVDDEEEKNSLPFNVMVALRKRKFEFRLAEAYFKSRPPKPSGTRDLDEADDALEAEACADDQPCAQLAADPAADPAPQVVVGTEQSSLSSAPTVVTVESTEVAPIVLAAATGVDGMVAVEQAPAAIADPVILSEALAVDASAAHGPVGALAESERKKVGLCMVVCNGVYGVLRC